MSAQEGPISCYYCHKRQNSSGRCTECADNNDLNIVITYRWSRDIHLDINNKRYLVSFSNATGDAEVSVAGSVPFLKIPVSANLTLQNIRDKLKTYFVFL